MKKTILFLIIIGLFLPGTLFGQADKVQIKLETWFNAGKFGKVIKYKNGNLEKLSSKSLYLKGLASNESYNYSKAIQYFDQAIKKGPVGGDMYYHKALSLINLEKPEESLAAFDQAIQLDAEDPGYYYSKGLVLFNTGEVKESVELFRKCVQLDSDNPTGIIALASVYSELNEPAKSAEYFAQSLTMLEMGDPRHQECNYNLGVMLQAAGDFSEAKDVFSNHVLNYPEDYSAKSKLIQMHYKLDEISSTADLKSELKSAYRAGKLSGPMREMFCFDQFESNGQDVMAFESFEISENQILPWKHKFFVLDSLGEIDFSVVALMDTINTGDQFYLSMERSDTLYQYGFHYTVDSTPYSELKSAVLDILNDRIIPIDKLGDFQNWKAEQTSKLGLEGSSFETAIVVNSIAEEYQWLATHFPGYSRLMQSLVYDDGKPYDILQVRLPNGEIRDFYFDISKFFGKGF